MILADGREEDNPPVPEGPQVEKARDQQRRLASDEGRDIPISEIEMSKPMEIPTRKEILQKQMDEFLSEESQKNLREGLENYARLSREERYRTMYDISEDDKQYKIEKEPKSFEDYLQQIRDTGGVLAVMNPATGIPSFVLSYEKDHIKFYPYFSKYISKFYDFNPNKDPRRFADAITHGSASGDYYGRFKEDVVNNIIFQDHPMKIDLRKLPEDVEMILNEGDDDVDDDRGGGRLATLRRTLDKWRRYQYGLYEGEEEEKEESDKEPSGDLFMGGPKDEPHDDDDEAFVTPPQSNKSSDEFRLELPKLESDKEELIKELESKKAEVQKVKDYNQG